MLCVRTLTSVLVRTFNPEETVIGKANTLTHIHAHFLSLCLVTSMYKVNVTIPHIKTLNIFY